MIILTLLAALLTPDAGPPPAPDTTPGDYGCAVTYCTDACAWRKGPQLECRDRCLRGPVPCPRRGGE